MYPSNSVYRTGDGFHVGKIIVRLYQEAYLMLVRHAHPNTRFRLALVIITIYNNIIIIYIICIALYNALL